MTRTGWGAGLKTVDQHGNVLDTWYRELGVVIDKDAATDAGRALTNIKKRMGGRKEAIDKVRQVTQVPWLAVTDLDEQLQTPEDAYLRLHLLSRRLVQPNTINLDGTFGVLNNVAWTNLGPVAIEDVDSVRMKVKSEGGVLMVHGLDKFPRMTDYVVPSGVRIADADRVRLGAHLAEGTAVMHEGFCNFNAGTLGTSMVEGRISAGVVVGDGSDIGGGASIQGTLSGGGTEVISIGERCLLGANAGIGISLGDDCVVEAGLYVTAATPVALVYDEDWVAWVKQQEGDVRGTMSQCGYVDNPAPRCRQLSGINNALFYRDGKDGRVICRARNKSWGELNSELHTAQ